MRSSLVCQFYPRKLRRVATVQLVIVTILCCSATFLLLARNAEEEKEPRAYDLPDIEHRMVNSSISHCVIPNLFRDTNLLDAFYPNVEPLICKGHTWVYTKNGRLFYNYTVIDSLGLDRDFVSCVYNYVTRNNDYRVSLSDNIVIMHDGIKIPTEFFKVTCKANVINDDTSSEVLYENYHAHVVFNATEVKKMETISAPTSGLGMDVLLIGFDSVSQVAFQRNLPKTFAYMRDVLGSVVLEGYNIVGDGTPQALIPILTGATELELPPTLWRIEEADYVDVYPMIWKDFKRAGYMTFYSEDQPRIGTFQYRMRGFKQQPTDHYGRTFYLGARKKYKGTKFCLEGSPLHKIAFDYASNFLFMYKKMRKFLFLFHNELSHADPKFLQYCDDDFLQLIESLHQGGLLDNAMLIIFSDHGSRYTNVRASMQGRLEERMPFVSVTLPKWFKEKYRAEYNNLLANAKRLTTPFDLHALMHEVIDFQGAKRRYTKDSRQISLFGEVEFDRTCDGADIETHWCACLKWKSVDVHDDTVFEVAKTIIDYINNLTAEKRQACVELQLDEVVNAEMLKPNEDVLTYSKSKDIGGFQPVFSSSVKVLTADYRVTIRSKPGGALFESTARVSEGGKPRVKEDMISRINKYGEQPHCIYNQRDDLRKYCYCRDLT